jgi:hypothetical protein
MWSGWLAGGCDPDVAAPGDGDGGDGNVSGRYQKKATSTRTGTAHHTRRDVRDRRLCWLWLWLWLAAALVSAPFPAPRRSIPPVTSDGDASPNHSTLHGYCNFLHVRFTFFFKKKISSPFTRRPRSKN